jgi:hypothetical protein
MASFLRKILSLAVVYFASAGLSSVAADDPSGWGTVKGRIVWGAAAVPERKVIAAVATHNDKKHCLSKGEILDEDVVVNPKNNGLRWAFVSIGDGTDADKAPPIHPDLKEIKQKEVVMDQPCCMFVPHALAMRQGQVLVAKNSAPVLHNFKWTGNVALRVGGNITLSPKDERRIKNLPAYRIPITINCNIHPWMTARVAVFSHPYFAVTDEDGAFEIAQAPAGNFRLRVSHDKGWLGGAAGRNGQPIVIKAGAVTDLGNLRY